MTPDLPGGPDLGNLWGPAEPAPDTVPAPVYEPPAAPFSPGPWAPSPGQPVPVQRPQVPPVAVVGAAVVGVVILAIAVLFGVRVGREGQSAQTGDTAAGSAVSVPSAGETRGTTADGANVSAETRAAQQLHDLRDGDLTAVAIEGQWVAQLASKYVGITDPQQTTTSGSNTFAATDILAEHQALRGGDNRGARVVLLLSTDYGKRQMINGHALWVTFALGDFASASDVEVWCAGRFPGLDSVALTNACTPRTLKPPGS